MRSLSRRDKAAMSGLVHALEHEGIRGLVVEDYHRAAHQRESLRDRLRSLIQEHEPDRQRLSDTVAWASRPPRVLDAPGEIGDEFEGCVY